MSAREDADADSAGAAADTAGRTAGAGEGAHSRCAGARARARASWAAETAAANAESAPSATVIQLPPLRAPTSTSTSTSSEDATQKPPAKQNLPAAQQKTPGTQQSAAEAAEEQELPEEEPYFLDLVADSTSEGDNEAQPAPGAASVEPGTPASHPTPASASAAELAAQEDIMPEPTDADMEVGLAAATSIPDKKRRREIRHQRKPKPGEYVQKKSRKKRYQAMRAPVRDGTRIYHAHNLKALYVQALLRNPLVVRRLEELKARPPVYNPPPAQPTRQAGSQAPLMLPPSGPTEVPWPSATTRLYACQNPKDVRFKDIGDLGICPCLGDCYRDECDNATQSVYCTDQTCNLDAACSNAVHESPHLRLFQTPTLGLGVFTTSTLEVGDTIGEYCGVLVPMEGVRPGIPAEELKKNSGCTMVMNARTTDGKFVYIEPKRAGSIMRFLNHACHPNAAFVEMQNRAVPKVVVMMLRSKPAGSEITVNYGSETWFQCQCARCSAQGAA